MDDRSACVSRSAEILCWQFFFRLFADPEKEPPLLDYTQMLLYFACHSNAEEGVYRALSVAVGTHIFQPIELVSLTTEKVIEFRNGAALGSGGGCQQVLRF